MSADAAFWNKLAAGYAAKPVERPEAFEKKIAITKSLMDPTDVVLDIGCGTGSLALRLAPDAADVHGLDISSEMTRIATEKARAEGTGNVTFHTGPFDDGFDAFADASLDGICAYSVLHLIEDREAALERIHRMLKPGGFFVSSTECLGGTWIPYGLVIRLMRAVGKAPDVQIFSKEDLIEEMTRVGFVDLSAPDVGAKDTTAFLVAAKPA